MQETSFDWPELTGAYTNDTYNGYDNCAILTATNYEHTLSFTGFHNLEAAITSANPSPGDSSGKLRLGYDRWEIAYTLTGATSARLEIINNSGTLVAMTPLDVTKTDYAMQWDGVWNTQPNAGRYAKPANSPYKAWIIATDGSNILTSNVKTVTTTAKALIGTPFSISCFWNTHDIKGYLQQMGFDQIVDHKGDIKNVTAKNLSGCLVFYALTHGVVDDNCFWGPNLNPKSTAQFDTVTLQQANPANVLFAKLPDGLSAPPLNLIPDGLRCAVAFLNCCDSAAPLTGDGCTIDDFVNKFVKSSPPVGMPGSYIGWNTLVLPSAADPGSKAFFNALAQDQTVDQAVAAANVAASSDPNQPITNLQRKEGGSQRLNMK